MKISELEDKITLSSLIAEDYQLRKVSDKGYCVNPCPICGHHDHFTVYPETNSYSSFNECCQGGKAYKYLQEVKGLSEDQAYEELQRLAGISPIGTGTAVKKEDHKKSANIPQPAKTEETKALTPADYTAQVMELYHFQTDQDRAYFSNRGISLGIVDKYKLCIGDMGSGRRAILPVWENDKVIYYTGRALTDQQKPKYQNATGSAHLFNSQYITNPINQDPIIICEGIFDALSIEDVGGQAVALNSTSNVRKLLSLCAEYKPAGKLILALDNDIAGMNAKEELEKGLRGLGITFRAFGRSDIYKDPNEYLRGDREAFAEIVQNIISQGRADQEEIIIRPDAVSKYLDDVFTKDIDKFKSYKDRKTGFKNLDALTGGLYPGLYVIGAISSLGKTTFAHQMGDQLAGMGDHVLFFSLEQNRLEMVTKSLSRITAKHNETTAVSAIKIRGGKLTPEVIQAAEEYNKIADHISVIECNFETNIYSIIGYTKRYMEANEVKPIVIVDYLQIIPPTDPRQGDKEKVDNIVRGLKKLQSENDLVVFVISSINRANYLTPIDFESFKESGGIEYTADVVWGLQLQILNDELFNSEKKIKEKREKVRVAKKAIPRKIELICLKNRYGVSSYSCGFKYDPRFDLFEPDYTYKAFDDFDVPSISGKRL